MSLQAPSLPDLRREVHNAARRARVASRVLALLPTVAKDQALQSAAEALAAHVDLIPAANAADGQVAGLPDPVGEVLRGSPLPNGLLLREQRVPLGVVGMIYEGRPNVTVDAFGLALKSGNAVLLRGSASAAKSNQVLVEVLRASLVSEDLPAASVQLLPATDRSTVTHLIQ